MDSLIGKRIATTLGVLIRLQNAANFISNGLSSLVSSNPSITILITAALYGVLRSDTNGQGFSASAVSDKMRRDGVIKD